MPRQVVPDRRGHSQQNRRRDHRVGAAKIVEKRNQNQATAGGAEQIEEIHAIHALDAFRHRDRNHRARKKERQRAREIDAGQRQIAEFSGTRQDEDQRSHHGHAIDHRQDAQLVEDISAAAGDHIGKQAARAQPEQCNRDCKKREMVIEDYRKDARERQLQDQCRKRGERDAQIELRPLGLAGFIG